MALANFSTGEGADDIGRPCERELSGIEDVPAGRAEGGEGRGEVFDQYVGAYRTVGTF